MNKKIVILSSTVLLLFPLFALAIVYPDLNPGTNIQFVNLFDRIFNFIWPLFLFISVIMFLAAGILFLSADGDSGQLATARKALLWGIVGVIVGILAFSIPLIIANVLMVGL